MSEFTEVVAASVVADTAGRVLMVREGKPSALDRWSLPAGRVERDETLREAARREAYEETGVMIDVGALVGVYHAPTTLEGGSAVVFVFIAAAVGGAIETSAAHPDVRWIDRDELDELIDRRRVRGAHVAIALRAVDTGVVVPDGVVTTVPPSAPPARP